ncbi:hypothetical protein D3C71_1477360 [compost metagenome]
MSSSKVCTNSRLAGLSSTHSTLGARLDTGSPGSLRTWRGLTRSESARRSLRVQAGLACNWLWGLGTERWNSVCSVVGHSTSTLQPRCSRSQMCWLSRSGGMSLEVMPSTARSIA